MFADLPPLDRPRRPQKRGTARRRALFSILRGMAAASYAPTIAELGTPLGVGETAVRHHLRWLADDGIIEISPSRLDIRILRADGDGPAPERPRRSQKRGRARRRALFAVLQRMEGAGYAPLITELAAELGVGETAVRYHLRWLADDGIIEIGPLRLNIRILREDGV